MLITVFTIFALGVGIVIGRLGTFSQLNRIETKIRAVGNQAHAEALFDNELTWEWLESQIDWILEEEFR